jgi:chromosome partitioning protein
MLIWTLANQKGGVGKTTSTVALGGLAASFGLRVLLVDMDPQGSLSSYFRLNPDTQTASTFTLFQSRKQLSADLVGQLVLNTAFQGLCFIPASVGLATLERQAIGPDGMGLVLQRSLACVADDFDLAIIDCPPVLGVLMVNALAACQKLIVPVQTEYLALQGTERLLHTLGMINRSRPQPLPYVLLPTLFDRRTQACVTSLRTLRNTYGDKVWPGRIPVDTKFRDASKLGIPPHLLVEDSQGLDAYRSFFSYLLPGQQLRQLQRQVS